MYVHQLVYYWIIRRYARCSNKNGSDWIDLSQYRDKGQDLVNTVRKFWVPYYAVDFLTGCRTVGIRKHLEFVGWLVSYLVRLTRMYTSTRIELLSTATELHIYDQKRTVPSLRQSFTQLWTEERGVRTEASPCGICGGQCGTATSSSPSTSVFPWQYRSAIALYSFVHLALNAIWWHA